MQLTACKTDIDTEVTLATHRNLRTSVQFMLAMGPFMRTGVRFEELDVMVDELKRIRQ